MLRSICRITIALLGLQLWSCVADKLAGQRLDNEAPKVWLASAPPEGSLSDYRIHLYWGGWDPDGEIAYYEFIMTDNRSGIFDPADTTTVDGVTKWRRVVASDSVFTFTADVVADSSAVDFDGPLSAEEFRRSHTFFVRAVDREGLISPEPAYRSFTARTLSPTIFVTQPPFGGFNPAFVPPISTFRWEGRDYVSDETQVQEPEAVRWILMPAELFGGDWDATLAYIRANPDAPEWSDWNDYDAPGDSGRFWTTPTLPYGPYCFAAQVKDEAGAVSPVFDLGANVRRIQVTARSSGPELTLRNKYIGAVKTASARTPPAILDMPSSVAMEFEFEADASGYGGTVVCYRYGWDVLDLADPDQWEVTCTPFVGSTAKSPPRTFFFGSHNFVVEVVDNSGLVTRAEVVVNIIPFTMERSLLIIDDRVEGSDTGWARTAGGSPSDQEHDQFWEDIAASVEGFSPATDIYELNVGGKTFLPIQAMAPYKTVIWVAWGTESTISGSHLAKLIKFPNPNSNTAAGRVFPNLAALFMAAGGRLLICGNQIMPTTINVGLFDQSLVYPIIFRYEMTGDQDGVYEGQNIGEHGVGETSFAYNECCLNVLDEIYIQSRAQIRTSSLDQRCGISGLRGNDKKMDGLRVALPLDESTGGGFPRLELRAEAAGDPSRYFHESRVGLNADLYNPPYFAEETLCRFVTETSPPRDCFQPIYGNGCLDQSSTLYGVAVAFWTSAFANVIAEGSAPGRSAVWGFDPVFFDPQQVGRAINIVLHDEWQLPVAGGPDPGSPVQPPERISVH